MSIRRQAILFGALCMCAAWFVPAGSAQSLSSLRKVDIETGRAMLRTLKSELEKNFYDPAYHGVDLNARFEAAEEKLKQAKSLGQVYGIVGQPLLELNDPHTFFIPPPRGARVDYGFQVQMIGDRPFIVAVRPGTEAEKKGIKVGSEVITLDGYRLTRGNLWKLFQVYYVMRPGSTPTLVVMTPDGKEKTYTPSPKVTQNSPVLQYETSSNGRIDTKNLINWVVDEGRRRKHRFHNEGEALVVWNCPHFDVDDNTMSGFMRSVKGRKALILDLRNNVGGREEMLEALAGMFFEKDTKIADFKGRKEFRPLVAQGQGDSCFKGAVVALVDSTTSGAAELLARLLQIEKRGKVIGDVTCGSTMKATLHRYELGENPFASSISDALTVMSDGQTLERAGVVPDEKLLPSVQDLAAERDPVIARAAELLGFRIDVQAAGKFFPPEWEALWR
ncbi:MAG: PDZ domain-containing protein [Acidobacteria bacterium]|nr:PDZ domain-containing protein [Acidobacteriota bacterium]